MWLVVELELVLMERRRAITSGAFEDLLRTFSVIRSLTLSPQPAKPLLPQGLFISSLSHKDAPISLFSLQCLAPLLSTQPDDNPIKALSAS